MHQKNPSAFALSLSGGGASAFAYAGFVDELRAHNILPPMYAGLSGGALFSIFFASGYTLDQMMQFVDAIRTPRVLNTHFHHMEIIDHHAMIDRIRALLPYKTFESLPVPVVIFASDLGKQQPIAIHTGDVASAIVASCSVYPWFQPIKRRGMLLGDGGFTTYYGAHLLRELGVPRVVGVDVTGISERTFAGILRSWFKQINASVTSNARYELHEHPVDLDIRISSPSPSFLSIDKHVPHLVAAGRHAAQEYLREIKKIVTV